MTSQCSQCGASFISNPGEFDLNNIAIASRTLVRISQLLTTNEPPQEPELTVLRPVAKETAARLARLDKEIARLHDQLKQLEEERAVLAEYHAQNTAILSPMRRMPSEILGEIFSWSVPLNKVLDVEDSPWVLTHISRRWRAVAIAQSSLWSRVYLDFSMETDPFDMVKTQIERARTLKVIFFGSHEFESGPQVDMLQLLLERSSIWEQLHLGLIPALVPLMTASRGHFPLLRRARVRWDDPESQRGLESIDVFRMAPSLAEIAIHSRYRFVPVLLPIGHQLTRYDFDAPWTTHSELLKSLPNLREVRIVRNFDRSSPWPPPGDPILLPRLRSLYVSHVECLDYLDAPILENMAFQSRRRVETHDHIERFFARSSCPVRNLSVVGLPGLPFVEKILGQQKSITEFALWIVDIKKHNADAERDLFAAFLTRFAISDSTTILPHISKLDFGCKDVDAISYPLYLKMLDSRWNASDCLLKAAELLFLNAISDPDPESLARMETLRRAGLQFSLLSGDVAYTRVNEWIHIPSWD